MRRRNKPLSDQLSALLVVILLLLTALGNAVVLFLFSLAGILLGLVYYRNSLGKGAMLAAAAGFCTGLVIALVMLFR